MLLEALIGLLIFSIGILALVAMQSAAISQMRDAQYLSEASALTERMMGELILLRDKNATGASGVISAWQSDVTAALPSGAGAITQTITALGKEVSIQVTWRPPGASSDSNHVTFGVLKYND